jgi:lysophospholipase L1-like esterase
MVSKIKNSLITKTVKSLCSSFPFSSRYNIIVISLLFIFFIPTLEETAFTSNSSKNIWTGTWGTAPQLVEPNNMPPAPGLTNNTLRQVLRISAGGEIIRLRFSNVFSKDPVTIKLAGIAVSINGYTIDKKTQKLLKFKGKKQVTMRPGGEVLSDPLKFHLESGSKLAITICFGNTSSDITGHPGSRTTSYIVPGNRSISADFGKAVLTDHWYVINGIDVMAPKTAGAIAILGNSITDGRGSGTNKQNRWPDILSERLLKNPATSHLGVLNMGIGGNCVVSGGLGPTALSRFDRDILSQSNVKWLIVFEGINDIGGSQNKEAASRTVKELISAYSRMIEKAHSKGIKVYGATLLPFGGSFYDTDFRQTSRDTVNTWIRGEDHFDAVIDFDQFMRDPSNFMIILPGWHSGDFLHPNEAGYKKMAGTIDLRLFE